MNGDDIQRGTDAVVIRINGVLAAELTALKSAPITRLLLLYCLVGQEVATL